MFTLNRIMVVGNLTRDPEKKQLPSGTDICEFGIAVNSKMKDKDEVCFINVTVFGKPAEACARYLAKGSGVYVEGRLVYESWEDRQGAKRSNYKIVANTVQFTSSGKGECGQSGERRERRENQGRSGGVSGEYGPPPTQSSEKPVQSYEDGGELPPF